MKRITALLTILFLLIQISYLTSQLYPKFTVKGFYKINGGYKTRSNVNYLYRFGAVDVQSKRLGGYDFFDAKGNIIRSTYFASGSSRQILGHKYNYDNYENLIEDISYKPDGSVYTRYIYKYNNINNKTEETFYNSDGSLLSKIVYFYDNIGNMIKSLEYDNYERLLYKKTFKYNHKREKIEEFQHYLDGRSGGVKTTFEYDANGNMVESVNLFMVKSIYKYDDGGNVIEEIAYSGDKIFKRTTYKYDLIGNRIETVEYDETYGLDEPSGKTIYLYSK